MYVCVGNTSLAEKNTQQLYITLTVLLLCSMWMTLWPTHETAEMYASHFLSAFFPPI